MLAPVAIGLARSFAIEVYLGECMTRCRADVKLHAYCLGTGGWGLERHEEKAGNVWWVCG